MVQIDAVACTKTYTASAPVMWATPELTQFLLCRREGYPQQSPRAELLDRRPHEAHLLRSIPVFAAERNERQRRRARG